MEFFGKRLHSYNDDEHLFLTNSKQLINFTQNWKFNRPQDPTRIEEICEYIEKTNNIDGIIYIGQLIKNKTISYVCYDGNHRRSALEKLEKEYYVLVHVLCNTTDFNIKDRFEILNKSNPVPDIYIREETDNNVKIMITELVKKITEQWPKHQSGSKKPQRPNFNRDNLTEKLDDILKKKCIDDMDNIDSIWNRILQLNKLYKDFYKDNVDISQKIMKKCNKNDCYLFLKEFTLDLFK